MTSPRRLIGRVMLWFIQGVLGGHQAVPESHTVAPQPLAGTPVVVDGADAVPPPVSEPSAAGLPHITPEIAQAAANLMFAATGLGGPDDPWWAEVLKVRNLRKGDADLDPLNVAWQDKKRRERELYVRAVETAQAVAKTQASAA